MFDLSGARDGFSAELPAETVDVPPVGVDEVVAAVIVGLQQLAAAVRGCAGWPGARRGELLTRVDRLAGLVAGVRAQLLVAQDGAGTGVATGDRDLAAARARSTRIGYGQARRELDQARTLAALPGLAGAVAEGQVPLAHVDALARVAASAPSGALAALASSEGTARLVALSQRSGERDFTTAVTRLLSPDAMTVERDTAAAHRARFFTLSHQPDGTYLKGRLDPYSGEVLRVALAGVGTAPDAERDRAQAGADALVALAQRAMSGMAGVRPRRLGPGGRREADAEQGRVEQDRADARVSGTAARPVVSLLLPAQTLAELQQWATSPRTDRRAWAPVAPASLEDGTPVAMSTLAQVLCDCEIARIALAADGVPLDLGRSQRLYTGAHRRAVIVRDRHCAWNGCAVPAAYGEVHHIRWWDRDRGSTSVDNAVLLCSHHHHVVHRLDLQVDRQPAHPDEPVRYVFSDPAGRVVSTPPAAAEADRQPFSRAG